MVKHLWRELMLAARFAIVGVLATATHVLLVWWLMHVLAMPPQWANFLAFLGAFGVSFLGNYHFTFGAPGKWQAALPRFLGTSLAAYGLNALTLAALLHMGQVAPFTAALIAAACVPGFSFAASRLWVFRVPPSPSPRRSSASHGQETASHE